MIKSKNKVRVVVETIFWVIFSLILAVIVFFKVTSSNFNLPFKSFLIQSGSMEPTIMTGDIILVQEQSDYIQRDIITFYDHGDRVVTHRILEEKQVGNSKEYITQGDNNQTPDIAPVPKEDVIGKHFFTVPKLGYLIAKSKSKTGILFLIVAPATIIIYDEVSKIFSSVSKKDEQKKGE